MEIVRAVSLSKKFGRDWGVRNVNLSLGEGLHVLLGPNGSGKTTFLKLVVGMLKPTSGYIRVFGLDPRRDVSKLSNKVSFAFEGLPLPWWLSGEEFAEHIFSVREPSRQLEKLLSSLGVENYWKKTPLAYSSGMKKRLQLALALGCDAELYVLDEPFTLLDASSIEAITAFIREAVSSCKTFLVATHFLPEGFTEMASTIVRFLDGSVVEVRSFG